MNQRQVARKIKAGAQCYQYPGLFDVARCQRIGQRRKGKALGIILICKDIHIRSLADPLSDFINIAGIMKQRPPDGSELFVVIVIIESVDVFFGAGIFF